MRTTLTAMGLLVFAQIVLGQNAPPSAASEKVLTIRISADGICTFLDGSTPCVEVGRYLLSKHLAQDGHVHIAVDRASKYEMVAATLKSLDDAGFKKVGFVNNDFLQ
jgi:biopolymer transport protein ExbD